jgi:hypothetical protein
MVDHRFVVNLRYETLEREFLELLKPWGFLLAPKYATARIRQEVARLRGADVPLFVDNGNYPLIEQTAAQFEDQGALLLDRVAQEEEELEHKARPGDLSSELREDCTIFARAVRSAARQVMGNGEQALNEQLSLSPSHVIGVEDITLATFLKLNLDPSYLMLPRDYYRRWNASVARRATERLASLDPGLAANYYPVASAFSYKTAYDAGVVFATAGLRKAAMGFGAFMAERDDTDYLELIDRRIDLPGPMPNRYIRAGAVAKGFWDGYKSHVGQPPEAFHFLGLGAPIMVGLATLFAWGTPQLTFDATSPIKDAFAGALYFWEPSFLKIETKRLASHLATGEWATWECRCPFCEWFIAQYPFDYAGGTGWLESHQRDIEDQDLIPGGGLYDAYPLLSQPASGVRWGVVRIARVGHNHWAIDQITAALRRQSTSRDRLKTYLGDIADKYETSAGTEKYAQAIRFLHELAA